MIGAYRRCPDRLRRSSIDLTALNRWRMLSAVECTPTSIQRVAFLLRYFLGDFRRYPHTRIRKVGTTRRYTVYRTSTSPSSLKHSATSPTPSTRSMEAQVTLAAPCETSDAGDVGTVPTETYPGGSLADSKMHGSPVPSETPVQNSKVQAASPCATGLGGDTLPLDPWGRPVHKLIL